jgi:hypothetical protein
MNHDKKLLKALNKIEIENIEEFFIKNKAVKSYKRYYLEFEGYIFILDGSYVLIDDREGVIGVYKPTLRQLKALIFGFTAVEL